MGNHIFTMCLFFFFPLVKSKTIVTGSHAWLRAVNQKHHIITWCFCGKWMLSFVHQKHVLMQVELIVLSTLTLLWVCMLKKESSWLKKKKKVAEINCPAILLSRPTTYLGLTRWFRICSGSALLVIWDPNDFSAYRLGVLPNRQ